MLAGFHINSFEDVSLSRVNKSNFVKIVKDDFSSQNDHCKVYNLREREKKGGVVHFVRFMGNAPLPKKVYSKQQTITDFMHCGIEKKAK